MRTTVGGLVERLVDNVANRVPVMRVVYNASKMAAETAFGEQESLQTPVKLEVWEGLRMTAFKTGKVTEDGRKYCFCRRRRTLPRDSSSRFTRTESRNWTRTSRMRSRGS